MDMLYSIRITRKIEGINDEIVQHYVVKHGSK